MLPMTSVHRIDLVEKPAPATGGQPAFERRHFRPLPLPRKLAGAQFNKSEGRALWQAMSISA
jgi:hypothetical protein